MSDAELDRYLEEMKEILRREMRIAQSTTQLASKIWLNSLLGKKVYQYMASGFCELASTNPERMILLHDRSKKGNPDAVREAIDLIKQGIESKLNRS